MTSLSTINDPLGHNLDMLDDDAIIALSETDRGGYVLVQELLPVARFFKQTVKATQHEMEEAQDDLAEGNLSVAALRRFSKQLRLLEDNKDEEEERNFVLTSRMILRLLRVGLVDENLDDVPYIMEAILRVGFPEDIDLVLGHIRSGRLKAKKLPEFIGVLQEIATPSQLQEFMSFGIPFDFNIDSFSLYPEILEKMSEESAVNDEDILEWFLGLLSARPFRTLNGPYGYYRVILKHHKKYWNLPLDWEERLVPLAEIYVWPDYPRDMLHLPSTMSDDIRKLIIDNPLGARLLFRKLFTPPREGEMDNMEKDRLALELGKTTAGWKVLHDNGYDVSDYWRRNEEQQQRGLRFLPRERILTMGVAGDLRRWKLRTKCHPVGMDYEARIFMAIAFCRQGLSHKSGKMLKSMTDVDVIPFDNRLSNYCVQHGLAESLAYLYYWSISHWGTMRFDMTISPVSIEMARQRGYRNTLEVLRSHGESI